jgi:flagellar basal-body rod protein FlgB
MGAYRSMVAPGNSVSSICHQCGRGAHHARQQVRRLPAVQRDRAESALAAPDRARLEYCQWDTPNYKARDIDFSSALQSALDKANPDAQQTLNTTASKHYPNPCKTPVRWPMARRCCTAAWCRARWTATRWTWMWNATSSPITPSATAGITAINAQIKSMMAAIQSGS